MKNLRRLLIPPLLLITAACAGSSGGKYPFSPQFISAENICPCVLAAPSVSGSAAYKKEITDIIARQSLVDAMDKSAIAAEDHISPEMMVTPVLGAGYSEETHPKLFSLLRHAASDAWRIGDAAQDHWGRQRPWLADSRVQLLAAPIKRPGYPSGHSTTNHIWAHVLGEIFPDKRKALFARAGEIGQHRVDAGVHFSSDVLAGRKLAAVIYQKMRDNPSFQRELSAAKSEVSQHE